MLGLYGLELNGDFFAGDYVDSQVDVAWSFLLERTEVYNVERGRTKGAGSDLFPKPVLATNTEIESRRRCICHRLQGR